MIKVRIMVKLKSGIADPQGQTIEHALKSLEYGNVHNVHIGKLIEFEIEGDGGTTDALRAEVEGMCEKFLANPVIEEYSYEIL